MIAQIKDGKIKLLGDYPKVYNNCSPYQYATDKHKADGFYPYERPTPAEGEKLGELYLNGEVVTNYIAAKSPEELAAEAEAKKQVEKEQIKQKYLDRIVSDSVSLADALVLFKEWEPRPYALKEGAIFKGKPFRNTVEGNTNAPDKGGWTELK